MLVLNISKNIDADNSSVLLGKHPLQLERGEPVYETIYRVHYSNDSIKLKPFWNNVLLGDKFYFDEYEFHCRGEKEFKICNNQYDIQVGYGYIRISLNDEDLLEHTDYGTLSGFSIDAKKWQKKPYNLKSSYTKRYEFIDRQSERHIMVLHKYNHVVGFNATKRGDIYEPLNTAHISLYAEVSLGIAEQLVAKKEYGDLEIKFIVYDTDFDGEFSNNDRFSLDHYDTSTLFKFGKKVKISLPKRKSFLGQKFIGKDRKNTYYYIVNLINDNGSYFLEVKPSK